MQILWRIPEWLLRLCKRLGKPAHDADLAEKIKECQVATDKTYGYRRVWKWLQARKVERNPKTVLRVMKKYGLLSEIRYRRKWVNLRQQVHKYENLLARQFCADRPNAKWATDISYIHTKEGVKHVLRVWSIRLGRITYTVVSNLTAWQICEA